MQGQWHCALALKIQSSGAIILDNFSTCFLAEPPGYSPPPFLCGSLLVCLPTLGDRHIPERPARYLWVMEGATSCGLRGTTASLMTGRLVPVSEDTTCGRRASLLLLILPLSHQYQLPVGELQTVAHLCTDKPGTEQYSG